MEAIKKIIRVPEDHEIKIKVPQYLLKDEIMEVILIVQRRPEGFIKKIQELKGCSIDPDFNQDLKDISDDFKVVDLEGLEKDERV